MLRDLPGRTRTMIAPSTLALATGAAACGALAVGALAVGALAIGRLAVRKARIGALEVEELTVFRLRVVEPDEAAGATPPTDTIREKRAMAVEGLITLECRYGAKETMDRLAAAVAARGLTVFARIDHAAGAAQAGLALGPTELLIFGNARGGTPLMQLRQTIGIDLPLKALVWGDDTGATWLSYNDPAWLARRHALGPEATAATQALSAMLSEVARQAAEPDR